MTKYGWKESEAEKCREKLGQELGEDHPVLTRAVLAHMLIKEWFDSIGGNQAYDTGKIISLFNGSSAQDAVSRFVKFLLAREGTKWITQDKTPKPLLQEDEHILLLTTIADELWRTDCDSLNYETLMDITELVCEDAGHRPDVVHQCKERIIHHVLLSPEGNQRLRFCHIDFFHFFLGISLYNTLNEDKTAFALRKELDRKIYPYEAVRECVRRIRQERDRGATILSKLRSILKGLSRSTFINQNISELLLLHYDQQKEHVEFENLYCAAQVLDRVNLTDVVMRGCFFEELRAESLRACVFEKCEVQLLKMPRVSGCLSSVCFDEESIPLELQMESDDDVYELRIPALIKTKLRAAGAKIVGEVLDPTEKDFVEDDQVLLFFKAINLFNKRMSITENLLRTKLGVHYSQYEEMILPVMLKHNVLRALRARDGMPIYKLAISMEKINSFRASARGAFKELTRLLAEDPRQSG
jgi:hypothetical protein